MSENFMFSNSKFKGDMEFGKTKHQIWGNLWGTVILGMYYMMARIIIGEWIKKFKKC